MSRKPGGPGGRARTYAYVPIQPSCQVCGDRKIMQLVTTELSGVLERVKCPHCGPPHVPISTYFTRGKS